MGKRYNFLLEMEDNDSSIFTTLEEFSFKQMKAILLVLNMGVFRYKDSDDMPWFKYHHCSETDDYDNYITEDFLFDLKALMAKYKKRIHANDEAYKKGNALSDDEIGYLIQEGLIKDFEEVEIDSLRELYKGE